MRSRVSAGIVLWRRGATGLEVLLGHPGGPLFAQRDAGHWSIPKGEVEVAPDATDPAGSAHLLAEARREFAEETGHPVPEGPAVALGSIVQKGGKVVHAWGVEGDLDPSAARSNTFTMVWPPGTGRLASFPELDRVAWFGVDEARRWVKETQIPLLERLAAALV